MFRSMAGTIESILDIRLATIVLAVAVAVVVPMIGGTSADFTAVATNPGNVFQTAILSITTDHPSGLFVDITGLIPGDSITRSVVVENSGSAPFTYTVTGSSEGGAETVLWKNKIKGIQVSVSGQNGTFFSGPVSELFLAATGVEVPPGGAEVLTYVFSLPNVAGNAFQGWSQGIGITYNATQVTGQAR